MGNLKENQIIFGVVKALTNLFAERLSDRFLVRLGTLDNRPGTLLGAGIFSEVYSRQSPLHHNS